MSGESSLKWGEYRVLFSLPIQNVIFNGLSFSQQEGLLGEYPDFAYKIEAFNGDAIVCQIGRLLTTPSVSIEELVWEDCSIIRKIHHDNTGEIELTGMDFEAGFSVSSTKSTSWLSVVEESEFANPIVVENFLRILSAHLALKKGGVLLHSAGLVFDGLAYIFSGYSNAGKTTLTHKAHAAGAVVLSDDINVILPSEDGFRAYAVPFTGEFGRTLEHAGAKDSYPLAGVILLEQADKLVVEPVSASAAISRLLTASPFVNTDEFEMTSLFDSLINLVSTVPVIRLRNRRADPVAEIMPQVLKGLTEVENSNRAKQ